MTGRMTRRWHDLDARSDARAAGHREVTQLRDVPVHTGEVRLPLREREVLGLHHERRARERAVVAGVVELQMAVHDDRDVVRLHTERPETRDDRVLVLHHHLEPALRTERRVGSLDVHGVKAGVEHDVALIRSQQGRPHRRHDALIACGAQGPRLEGRARDVHRAGAEENELVHWCAPCASAWPRPRAMSQRLTGNAAAKAMTRPTIRLPQNSGSSSPAAIAPGTSRTMRLSTASITTIEIVSAASVSEAARPRAIPPRSSGTNVNE